VVAVGDEQARPLRAKCHRRPQSRPCCSGPARRCRAVRRHAAACTQHRVRGLSPRRDSTPARRVTQDSSCA
jgi:hypothetical protein